MSVAVVGPPPPPSPPVPPGGGTGIQPRRNGQDAPQSLNMDPYNLRAEELALEDCTLGHEVRRVWSEKEMVVSFGGRHFPGTPDGMFESWDGALICVQVVRVPLLSELTPHEVHTTLAQTVLTKVVKSQAWLQASQVVPNDFVIFCWLPFSISEEATANAEELMRDVRALDSRFSLRLRVPNAGDALFPARFACNHDIDRQRSRGATLSDVSTFNGTYESNESDEDDECQWDITWGWCEDFDSAAMSPTAISPAGDKSDGESECEITWDLTWDFNDMSKVLENG